jgi:phospholipase/lecithinase/hemolysin
MELHCCVQKLINEGGKTVVVVGMPPLGCAPARIVIFANQTGGEIEPDTGCLKDLNLLSKDHNQQLRRALTRLGGKYPGVRVIYADFYAPMADFAVSPGRYGFNGTDGVVSACCGGGGKYNFNLTAICGMPGASVCSDPSAYVSWDGVHLTEAANHFIADGWLRGPYAHPPILTTRFQCTNSFPLS